MSTALIDRCRQVHLVAKRQRQQRSGEEFGRLWRQQGRGFVGDAVAAMTDVSVQPHVVYWCMTALRSACKTMAGATGIEGDPVVYGAIAVVLATKPDERSGRWRMAQRRALQLVDAMMACNTDADAASVARRTVPLLGQLDGLARAVAGDVHLGDGEEDDDVCALIDGGEATYGLFCAQLVRAMVVVLLRMAALKVAVEQVQALWRMVVTSERRLVELFIDDDKDLVRVMALAIETEGIVSTGELFECFIEVGIGGDAQLLVDLLSSPETECLSMLLRYLKRISTAVTNPTVLSCLQQLHDTLKALWARGQFPYNPTALVNRLQNILGRNYHI